MKIGKNWKDGKAGLDVISAIFDWKRNLKAEKRGKEDGEREERTEIGDEQGRI